MAGFLGMLALAASVAVAQAGQIRIEQFTNAVRAHAATDRTHNI